MRARILQHDANDYLEMQRRTFELMAGADEVKPGNIDGDYVAGSWRQHDAWEDYETYLMKSVPGGGSWIAIEYGCGPGRNIRRWTDRFARIDGVDIAQTNLDNASAFLEGQIASTKIPHLFLTEGRNCGDAPKSYYDFAFSTICLQHICVWEVRFDIFRSLFECLKPGGRLSIQMGFGKPSPDTVPYHCNHYEAHSTNRACDVEVADPKQIEEDLVKIGFECFEYWIRPVGPGDCHPNWIFFTATKPDR
jgi:SAM-dependent methyltransferase